MPAEVASEVAPAGNAAVPFHGKVPAWSELDSRAEAQKSHLHMQSPHNTCAVIRMCVYMYICRHTKSWYNVHDMCSHTKSCMVEILYTSAVIRNRVYNTVHVQSHEVVYTCSHTKLCIHVHVHLPSYEIVL
jgi:hypothetical protein